jgi:U3 small nucleolar RNA-associated protein 5
MSTAKRSRRRQAEAKAASPSQPASKRLKTAKDTHVPARNGLDFLVDEERRQGKKLEGRLTNGVPTSKATRVDDSHAVVAPSQNDVMEVGSTQENALEISSADSNSSEDESEDDDEGIAMNGGGRLAVDEAMLNGQVEDNTLYADAAAEAEDMEVDPTAQQAAEEDEDEDEVGEPSFGDLLQARHPEQIHVRASFPDPMADRQAFTHTSGHGALAMPSGTSLVTVLTQALKTNDKAQLESCFQQMDVPTIRSTVQRMQSQHVATLLQRLAERIHKRPGRTGSLLVWIQWSLVAHGAYLATQPDVMVKLRSLSQVLKERSSGLQPLLHLKGKLDMLSAQLDMRRSMQAASRARADAEDEDDEEGVIYVEGQDDDDWSDEDEAVSAIQQAGRINKRITEADSTRQQLQTPNTDSNASSDDGSENGVPNGVMQKADESSADEEHDEEGIFDIEAEEALDDSNEEESSEEEDSDAESESDVSEDDESDISEGVKPLDPSALRRKR